MTEEEMFPRYIPREEERFIQAEIARVRSDGCSRAVLVYGSGGIGKTSLLRTMAEASSDPETVVWVTPIDLDDPESWLLSDLERSIAQQIDPDNSYFELYQRYVTSLPRFTRPPGHTAVLSHLGRIKQVFLSCFQDYIESTGRTVVMVFDTVEAVRGMYLLFTLTQWMKAVPGTLFILSGRPPPYDQPDQIKAELEGPHQHMPLTIVLLREFTQASALAYLNRSGIGAALSADEKLKLVLLSRGHPLWLAFTVGYLHIEGLPQEAGAPLSELERYLPYQQEMSRQGQARHESYIRRLVSPYQEADFWHEAVKRLAVIRQSVNRNIWHRLMADRPLPPYCTNIEDAWCELLRLPWIRSRANGRYVTLHDAVADELAARIIPLHDQGMGWRQSLWHRAVAIYAELTDEPEAALAEELKTADERLLRFDPATREQAWSSDDEIMLITEVARLDSTKRELDQLKAAGLSYQLLSDFAAGCQRFLSLFEQAKEENDILFQDLLVAEMQRFLPGGISISALGDVVGGRIDSFRSWLRSDGADLYSEIGLSLADYLINSEQPHVAIQLLEGLPGDALSHAGSYKTSILLGNALMRIPGRVREALPHFSRALEEATAITSEGDRSLIADAYKELGYYYRGEGMWADADQAYRQARDALASAWSAHASDADRAEMASIQTNWAYIKGLVGSYREGIELVESAITVRRRLRRLHEEGNSWSVCGEIYRYARRYEKAWHAYHMGEEIFEELRNWPWLGLIYQEQAICLVQAADDDIVLAGDRDPVNQAKRLVTMALDICRDLNIRGYPSALNRAGRIFGRDDIDIGLNHLAEGIEWARVVSDGWFLSANLIESAELSYKGWLTTQDPRYLDQITAREQEVENAMADYYFPDLRGRWQILQGRMDVHDWLTTQDGSKLESALDEFKSGFALLATGFFASSGASLIPAEFQKLAMLLDLLPAPVRVAWLEVFQRAWRQTEGATPLLARLEELY